MRHSSFNLKFPNMKQLMLPALLLALCLPATAQEGVANLSKQAQKGFMEEVNQADGQYRITYKMAVSKKKDDVRFETYVFDKDMKFLKSEPSTAPKITNEDRPDKTVSYLSAKVGGCTSFDILSMKLRFTRSTVRLSWNYKKQRYEVAEVLSSETFKAKNELGNLVGYAAFNAPEDESLFVLAGADSKEEKRTREYFILSAKAGADIAQKKVDVSGRQSLVYAGQLPGNDVVLVFAPDHGSPDVSAYTYLRYSAIGELKNKAQFKSPWPNMLIMDASEKDGSVFFCGVSAKQAEAYDRVFEEYAGAISNPCFDDAENRQDQKWLKRANGKMERFHLLKFTGNNLDFASTDPISSFKEKMKTPAGERKATAYSGKKFTVQDFTVTPEGEYLVSGQLTGWMLFEKTRVKTYDDLVCLHFNRDGSLKAQYATNRVSTDKKSRMFPAVQFFAPSANGQALHWVILEAKGFKGYESFLDAYQDRPSYYSRYYPRVARLEPAASRLGGFTLLGSKDYFISRRFLPEVNPSDNSIVFIGGDKSFKKLWMAKYMLN